jgi:hypothetical protein
MLYKVINKSKDIFNYNLNNKRIINLNFNIKKSLNILNKDFNIKTLITAYYLVIIS